MAGRSPRLRHAGLRVRVTLLSLLMLAALTNGSSASLRTHIHDARSMLTRLTEQIRAEESSNRRLTDQLAQLDARIGAAAENVLQVDLRLSTTRSEIDAAQSEYEDDLSCLNTIARDAFTQRGGGAPGAELSAVLGAQSISELADAIEYTALVGQADVALANRVANVKASLALEAADLKRLSDQRASVVVQLQRQREAKANTFAAEQASLAALQQTRTQIVALLAKLKTRLGAFQLSAIGSSFQGQEHVTYGQWAGLFLHTMRAPTCFANKIILVAWQLAEFTQAAWNPLATTHPMPGSSPFNSGNVQNYVSLKQGLKATRLTIEGGLSDHGYGAILSSLRRCADPMTTAQAIRASDWCRGCAGGAYVTGDVPKVQAHYHVYAQL